jgi:hypothetical protein
MRRRNERRRARGETGKGEEDGHGDFHPIPSPLRNTDPASGTGMGSEHGIAYI